MEWIIGLVAGFVVGYLFGKGSGKSAGQPQGGVVYSTEDAEKKKENLGRIEEFIVGKDKFTNDDIQSYLGDSDTTVGRYLDELEKSGKIKQVGDTGSGVFYTKA